LRLHVFFRFVDISWIVDHHYLNFLVLIIDNKVILNTERVEI